VKLAVSASDPYILTLLAAGPRLRRNVRSSTDPRSLRREVSTPVGAGTRTQLTELKTLERAGLRNSMRSFFLPHNLAFNANR
jgi:hypothetical protein